MKPDDEHKSSILLIWVILIAWCYALMIASIC